MTQNRWAVTFTVEKVIYKKLKNIDNSSMDGYAPNFVDTSDYALIIEGVSTKGKACTFRFDNAALAYGGTLIRVGDVIETGYANFDDEVTTTVIDKDGNIRYRTTYNTDFIKTEKYINEHLEPGC